MSGWRDAHVYLVWLHGRQQVFAGQVLVQGVHAVHGGRGGALPAPRVPSVAPASELRLAGRGLVAARQTKSSPLALRSPGDQAVPVGV